MAVDKNKLIAEATRFVQKGQWDRAIKLYERIVADDPRDVRVLLKIGELQQKKNDPGAAAETMYRVAEAYTEQGFFLKAVAVYKQIVRLTPEDISLHERLAALYQQLGILSDAMAQLQLVAAAAERAGDDQRLADVLRRITDLDPENPTPSAKLGEILARQGDARGALELLRRSADALKKLGRTDEYLRAAERIVALEPTNSALARELAQAYLGRGDTRRALAKLQLCFKQDPDDVSTLNLLAHAFTELGQVSKTVSVYKELARIHREQGRPGDARLAWNRVLELAPDDADALDALEPEPESAPQSQSQSPSPGAQGIEAAAGATADAPSGPAPRPIPSRAAPAAPAPPPAPAADEDAAPPSPPVGPEAIPKLLGEADVYLKYGLNAKAAEHLEKVLAIDPDQLDARERMRDLRATLGDVAGAVESGARAVRVASARGDTERARAALARLEAIAPGDPAVASLGAEQQLAPSTEAPEEPEALEPGEGADASDILVEVEPDESGAPEELILGEVAAPPQVESGVAITGLRSAPDLSDEIAEIEFYIHQGLLEEAREALTSLRALYADDAALAKLGDQLQRADIESALAADEGAIDELTVEPGSGAALGYSVDDALDQFRRGVEQQVRPEDAETHFDLGIAYKEMGLLDEALRELDLALSARPGRKEVDCLTMIGLCRMEQGDVAAAVACYRAALASEHVTPEARRALHYELAMAYRALGDLGAALWYLNKVLSEDPGFRDARGQAAALGEGEGRPPPDEPEIAGAPGVAATS